MIVFLVIALCITQAQAATTSLNWFRDVGDQGTTTIAVGDTITWVWTDGATHTVDIGSESSGAMKSASYSKTFTTAGSYSYKCALHTTMKGVIQVVALDPTVAPTITPTQYPTVAPTSSAPVQFATTAPTSPTVAPSVAPSLQPSAQPSFDFSPYLENILTYPSKLSSGSREPRNWNATLYVRPHRVSVPDTVTFNARCYCYEDNLGEMLCSHPGPTILMTPGDNFTLLLVNELGEQDEEDHIMNAMHQPNTTNIHTHGLHIDPNVDSIYLAAQPSGGTIEYKYQLPAAHSPGLHWYHAHTHGSSAMQLMGGLVGALIVQPPPPIPGLSTTSTDSNTAFDQNIPASILDAQSFLLVVTYVVFTQDTVNGKVSQGCGLDWVCDADTQAPLCFGNETRSPYDPFRQYTLQELSADTHSNMEIEAEFFAPSEDGSNNYHLVNGQYQPSIVVSQYEPFVLRVLHASGGKPLPLTLSDSSACNVSSIAWDGVYLEANQYEEEVNMVAASRVELQVHCSEEGIYSLDSEGIPIMYIVVNASTGSASALYITDSDLQSINRPYYLQDLRSADTLVASNYSVTINQDNTNVSVCGFWIGAGTDCSSIDSDTGALCPYHQFSGEKGLTVEPYLTGHKLVTYPGAVNEWKFYGMGSAFHPLHVHVNHFQIVSHSSATDVGADSYFRIGQWRDTLPPIADVVTFRFVAADFVGETILHCHFQRHEDLGMMDSYLVTDPATYAAVNSPSPTNAPTVAPTPVSQSPSASPSVLPTEAPSSTPTAAPSQEDAADTSSDEVVIVGASVGGAVGLLLLGSAAYYAASAGWGTSLFSGAAPQVAVQKVLPV